MTPLNPTEAHVLHFAEALLAKYDLTGWTVKWSRATKVAGRCCYSEKAIYLSRPLIKARGLENSKMVVLHEVAHALTQGAGHGPAWRKRFKAMGGDGKSHYASDTVDQMRLNTKYLGVCPNGHQESFSQRLTKKRSCTVCNPSAFDSRYVFRIYLRATGEEVGYQPRKARKPRRTQVVFRDTATTRRVVLPDGRSFIVPAKF